MGMTLCAFAHLAQEHVNTVLMLVKEITEDQTSSVAQRAYRAAFWDSDRGDFLLRQMPVIKACPSGCRNIHKSTSLKSQAF